MGMSSGDGMYDFSAKCNLVMSDNFHLIPNSMSLGKNIKVPMERKTGKHFYYLCVQHLLNSCYVYKTRQVLRQCLLGF